MITLTKMILIIVGVFSSYIIHAQSLQTNPNLGSNPNLTQQNNQLPIINESYRQKIEGFVKHPKNFAFLAYIVDYQLKLIEKEGQEFSDAFRLAVLEEAKDKYVHASLKSYVQTFGNIFSEEEFTAVSQFINSNEGLQYSASIVNLILQKNPILVKIPRTQLQKIDSFLSTDSGEKLKLVYPMMLQQLQKGLLEHIEKWIGVTNESFRMSGQNPFKELKKEPTPLPIH